jgi:hypothetical protein
MTLADGATAVESKNVGRLALFCISIALASLCIFATGSASAAPARDRTVSRAGVKLRIHATSLTVRVDLEARTRALVGLRLGTHRARSVTVSKAHRRAVTLRRQGCAACDLRVTVRRRGRRTVGLKIALVDAGRRAPGASPSPTVQQPPAASSPPSLPGGTRLRWAPPALTNPIQVFVSNATRQLNLDTGRDYVVTFPPSAVSGAGGVIIAGGHNVVVIGGHISIPWQGPAPPADSRRGLYLKDQTGTVHVEGVLIDGEDLGEGIDLDERRGATVQLENVRIVGVHGRDEVNHSDGHPDVVQSWGGPAELRVDRLTGTTTYQGILLNPTQYTASARTNVARLSNLNIRTTTSSGYLLWQASAFPLDLSNVWLTAAGRGPRLLEWPSATAWAGVNVGTPLAGDFVTAGQVGDGYLSPGYLA